MWTVRLILHDKTTGAVTGEEWWKGGKLDRADGPCGHRARRRDRQSPARNSVEGRPAGCAAAVSRRKTRTVAAAMNSEIYASAKQP